jgi:hypothetical protein
MKIRLTPKAGNTQRVVLLLNEFQPPTDRVARAYSLNVPATDIIEIPTSGVAPGEYLVRVQVDGAQSPLQVDENTGIFIRPRVQISGEPPRRALTTSVAPPGSGNVVRNPDEPAYNNGESVA